MLRPTGLRGASGHVIGLWFSGQLIVRAVCCWSCIEVLAGADDWESDVEGGVVSCASWVLQVAVSFCVNCPTVSLPAASRSDNCGPSSLLPLERCMMMVGAFVGVRGVVDSSDQSAIWSLWSEVNDSCGLAMSAAVMPDSPLIVELRQGFVATFRTLIN